MFFDHPVWGAIVAGALTAGKVAIELKLKWTKDNPHSHDRYRDIAYIYELGERFNDRKDNFSTPSEQISEASKKHWWKIW